MALRVFNTLSRQKEDFKPLRPGHIGFYICGPTVYDMAHLGHARCYIAFDTIVRYLRRRFEVLYVRNYTDVDDKIIKRAQELDVEPNDLSTRFIAAFELDMERLGCIKPDVTPQVTTHLPEIIALIERLIASGVAYYEDGDVYYAVEKFAEYGRLGRRSLDEMKAGARVAVSQRKRHPMDFVLWKTAKDGEPSWPSPWGNGRPGWHIECSAMSMKYLGESFDMHAGGRDLVFPHHENEIAQSEAVTHQPFVRYWLHNGFVDINNEKMSKSLNNFRTIESTCESYHPLVVRYYLLTTHYRSPINFSDDAMHEVEGRVKYLYATQARLFAQDLADVHALDDGDYREPWVKDIVARFEAAMDDDFNTAKALGDLSEVFRLINEILDKPDDVAIDRRTLGALKFALTEVGQVLGLWTDTQPHDVLAQIKARSELRHGIDVTAVERLVLERQTARQARDWARADLLRDELKSMGVNIKDVGGETKWELA